MVATEEEIARRVEEADVARSAKRSATAKRVGELAQRRAAIAEQLSDVERELGDVLAEAGDVIDTTELAQFADVPVADLTQWLNGRKPARTATKRKRNATGAKNADSRTQAPAAATPTTRPTSTPSEPGAGLGAGAATPVAAART